MRSIPMFSPGKPMDVVFFASGGPGNFRTALDMAEQHPDLLRVSLLICDRRGTPAATLAKSKGVQTLEVDYSVFAREFYDTSGTHGMPSVGVAFHDMILSEIRTFEDARGCELDFAVLAYRKIIRGALLERFADCAINQHPADLAVRRNGSRVYVGTDGHARSLRDGLGGARTSTIIVRENVDCGEIVCQGPFTPFAGSVSSEADIYEHEIEQKSKSDWPSLRFALFAIATGRLGLSTVLTHRDGCRVVTLDGVPQPYEGVNVSSEGEPN